MRHLYSAPGKLRLNREYIPHIAAYGYAILQAGYRPDQSAFSRFRSFSRDLVSKKQGQGYETDAEFYGAEGHLDLHIEVKTWPNQIDRIAAQLDAAKELSELPIDTVKELEYVLDLPPRYVWIVGPGTSTHPPMFFRVSVDGLNARFERLETLPPPYDSRRWSAKQKQLPGDL